MGAQQMSGAGPPGRSWLARRQHLFGELRDWTLWFIRVRWFVPPIVLGGTGGAHLLGFRLPVLPVLLVAVFILFYNVLLHVESRGLRARPPEQERPVQRFTYLQVGLDFLALFLLVHLTGGVASPLTFFLLFHVVFASVLLSRRAAYLVAGLAAAGLAVVTLVESLGWLVPCPLTVNGAPSAPDWEPWRVVAHLLCFAAAVFTSTYATTTIAGLLRRRIRDLLSSYTQIEELDEQLHTLYLVVQAIVSQQKLDRVLDIAKTELARVMGVEAISVKLLSEDRRLLRFAAAHGLPEALTRREIDLWQSPINRRVILGEHYVTGSIGTSNDFQFKEELTACGLNSVLFVPLTAQFQVIGVLGAYSAQPDRFGEEEVEFFRLTADVLAIAIANARAYEAIEQLIQERSRFMHQVAHNLRAPLVATISLLEVIRDGYVGELTAKQQEYLDRINQRARSMGNLIKDLLDLARSRTQAHSTERISLDLRNLAEKVRQTFLAEATKRGLRFELHAAPDLPPVHGDPAQLEQLLENLVSNAIKYTKAGSVQITLDPGPDKTVRLEVRDTGIGIPRDALPRLFTEFYRAPNTKAIEAVGTGLGLTLARETVSRHGGRIEVASEEGRGTTVTVHLPMTRPG